MIPAHRKPVKPVSLAAIVVAVVVSGGAAGALFEAGLWVLGFCVLASSGALAYVEHSRKALVVAPSATDVVNGFVATAEAEWTEVLENGGVFEWHPLSIRWKRFGGIGEPRPAEDIAAFYRCQPARRLVILGRPGSGKTVLAIRLAQQLSRSDDETHQMPVIISLSSWNPDEVRFADWLKERLAATYPSLSAVDATGRRIADALVDENKVLPILDGLDEMWAPRRSAALSALGRLAPFPFVLTCRTEEYPSQSGSGDNARPLRDIVIVKVEPLRPSDIRTYLGADEDDDAPSPVLRHLAENPDGPLARMLSTPLMCYLMRVGHAGSPGRPAELVALAERSPTALEEHLLERFVPALFDPGRSGPKRVRNWDENQATRWLSYLARDLVHREERDLIPWNMHKALTQRAPCGPCSAVSSRDVSSARLSARPGWWSRPRWTCPPGSSASTPNPSRPSHTSGRSRWPSSRWC
ncbi:NACHT domain-containing protein [Saccharothrix texasensis]|uniref:NACHT domain-containing protein n=1 Tax=Saccharothrix texasensis TaxID=103734 RepID=A0A3N1GZR3_9PSEU|nr:NACHT domain-containing protein [Saccharothrix texasensis]ROP35734.1 NACHT domain-containing protein [Saccharothrix texasensis]